MSNELTRRAAAAAFILLAFGAPAVADPAGEQAVRDFVARINAADGWTATVGTVRSDGDDTIAEGFVASREDPHVSIGAARLKLGGFRQGDGNAFTASAIKLEGFTVNVSADYGGNSQSFDYTLPSASVEGVSIPSTAGLSFDLKHMMRSVGELYTVMAKTEYHAFSVPIVTGTQTITPAGAGGTTVAHFAYRDLTADGLADGVFSGMKAGPITYDLDLPEGSGRVSFKMENVSAGRMDVGAMARIFDPAQYVGGHGDGVWHEIASDLTYSGISGTGPDGVTFHLGGITLAKMDGRQPDKPFADAFDQLLDPSIPDAQKSEMAPEALLAIYAPWRLGSMKVDSLSVAAPSQHASFDLGSMEMTNLSNEGIEGFSLSGMRGTGPEGFGSLDRLDLNGLVFPDVQAFIEMEKNKQAGMPVTREDVHKMLVAMPRLAHFGVHGVAGGLSPAEAVTLGDFTIDLADWNDFFAGTTDVRVNDLYIPSSLIKRDPKAAEVFSALGFERLVLGASLDHDWSSTAGTDEAALKVSVENGGDVSLSYKITGLTEDWIYNAIEASQSENKEVMMMAMLGQLGLAHLSLVVNDQTLVDRAFKAAVVAQHLNVGVDEYKKQTSDALPFILSSMVPPPVAERFSGPVQAFLEGGRKLMAEIAPPAPILIPDLMGGMIDPVGLMNRLNLTVQTQ